MQGSSSARLAAGEPSELSLISIKFFLKATFTNTFMNTMSTSLLYTLLCEFDAIFLLSLSGQVPQLQLDSSGDIRKRRRKQWAGTRRDGCWVRYLRANEMCLMIPNRQLSQVDEVKYS